MLPKEYWEVLINRQKVLEGVGFEQFSGPSVGEEVAEGPVGVVWADETSCSFHLLLRLKVKTLSTNIAGRK